METKKHKYKQDQHDDDKYHDNFKGQPTASDDGDNLHYLVFSGVHTQAYWGSQ